MYSFRISSPRRPCFVLLAAVAIPTAVLARRCEGGSGRERRKSCCPHHSNRRRLLGGGAVEIRWHHDCSRCSRLRAAIIERRVPSSCRFVLTHAFFAHRANVFGRHSGAIVRCAFCFLAEEIGK